MASYSFQLDILKSKELFEYPMKGHETLLHPKTLHTQKTASRSKKIRGVGDREETGSPA